MYARRPIGLLLQTRTRLSMPQNTRGGLTQRKPLSTKRPEPPMEDTPVKRTSNKRSLTIAIGGVLALLGVTGYTILRGNSTDTAEAPMAPTTALRSVETKRAEAKQKLDEVASKVERRSEAKQIEPLSDQEANAVLRAHQKSWTVETLRVDTNQVSSNQPIEDYLAWTALQPSHHMFGVFDGHAGYQCAEQIAGRMGPMLTESLEAIDQLSKSGEGAGNLPLARTVRQLEREAAASLQWDRIPLALTASFINMDRELVHDSLAEFRRTQNLTQIDELLGPAVSGSCGLVAVVDTQAKEVVVANTGDSRALLGVRQENGTWRAVRLSEDQTGQNQGELARMRREHPGEERQVIHRGRVLGALMPTRAFGDCRYKWPLEAQQDLFPLLLSRGHRYATTPAGYLTPPYVTARPVIVRHKLSPQDKFMVMATDGLYDQLTDAQVVDAVAQWYEAEHQKRKKRNQTLTTRDANAATHLIRAALSTSRGGKQNEKVMRTLLAIPAPHSRRFRDDISATVVMLQED